MAITPGLLATISSIYLTGPTGLLVAALTAAVAYPASKAISNLQHDEAMLKRIKPSDQWKKIAKKMGFLKVPPVYYLKSSEENAHAAYGNAVIKQGLFSVLNQEEINFVFAHELAHIQRHDGQTPRAATYSSMFNAANAVFHLYDMVFFSGLSSTAILTSGGAFIAYGIAMGTAIPLLSTKNSKEDNHEKEFDCDRRAVLATGDVDAAISAFCKMARFYDDITFEEDGYTHPSVSKRIEALENLRPEVELATVRKSERVFSPV